MSLLGQHQTSSLFIHLVAAGNAAQDVAKAAWYKGEAAAWSNQRIQ